MNLELENFLEENEKLVMSVKGDHNVKELNIL